VGGGLLHIHCMQIMLHTKLYSVAYLDSVSDSSFTK
jgi:hypothetical protein